jgi:hypothetical protein
MITTLLFVLVPFLFWRGTWFGRPLSEEETGKYLADTEHPRKTQHALVQIASRIEQGDASVRSWYPQVQELAKSEHVEIRATAAWVMGQDNQSAEFHTALLDLLADPEPAVARTLRWAWSGSATPPAAPRFTVCCNPSPSPRRRPARWPFA